MKCCFFIPHLNACSTKILKATIYYLFPTRFGIYSLKVKSPAPVYLKTLSAEWSFPMKKLLLSVFMLNLCLAPLTFAGEKAITTGDAHLDGDLQYLNEAAQKNLKGFCNDLSYHYDAEAGVADRLINIAGMALAGTLLLKTWVLNRVPENFMS